MFFNIFLTSYSQVHQAQKMDMKQAQPNPPTQQAQPLPDTTIQPEKMKSIFFLDFTSLKF